MSKQLNIEITEIFMAKAGNDWNKCFHGIIKRSRDKDGNLFVYGKIKVNDSTIEATAKDQWELGEKLDELVLFVLNKDVQGNTIENSQMN